MTHASSIAPQDQGFFNEIVFQSIKCGIIAVPSTWQGTRPAQREVHYVPGSNCWCCISCGGGRSRNDQSGLILAIVLFVLGFFVGISYTYESLRYENQAKRDLEALNQKKTRQFTPLSAQYPPFQAAYTPPSAPGYAAQTGGPPPPYQYAIYPSAPPPYTPSFNGTQQAYAPPSYGGQTDLSPPTYTPLYPSLSSQNQPPPAPPATPPHSHNPVFTSPQIFVDAEILLKGQRDKMAKLASAQAILTIGAGLVTTALLIMLITETNFTSTGIGTSGFAILFVGGVYYVIQRSSLENNYNEQQAANNISMALYPRQSF